MASLGARAAMPVYESAAARMEATGLSSILGADREVVQARQVRIYVYACVCPEGVVATAVCDAGLQQECVFWGLWGWKARAPARKSMQLLAGTLGVRQQLLSCFLLAC